MVYIDRVFVMRFCDECDVGSLYELVAGREGGCKTELCVSEQCVHALCGRLGIGIGTRHLASEDEFPRVWVCPNNNNNNNNKKKGLEGRPHITRAFYQSDPRRELQRDSSLRGF